MRGPSSLRGFTPAELRGPNRWQLLSLACYYVSKKRPTNSKMVRSEVWLRTYNLDLMHSHHLPRGIIFLRVFTVLPAPSHTVSSPGAWLGCAQQHQAGPLHNAANSLYGGKEPLIGKGVVTSWMAGDHYFTFSVGKWQQWVWLVSVCGWVFSLAWMSYSICMCSLSQGHCVSALFQLSLGDRVKVYLGQCPAFQAVTC